jgi:hypothetical protein
VSLYVAGVMILLGAIAVLAGLRGTQAGLLSSVAPPATPPAGAAPAGAALHAVTHAPVMV